jgi:hypothetical protein
MAKCGKCKEEMPDEGNTKGKGKFKGLCRTCLNDIEAEQKAKKPPQAKSAVVACDPAKCKSCDVVLKGSKYAHAIIPQSKIKKTELIILRFLCVVYNSAVEKELNADNIDIGGDIEGLCRHIEEQICSFVPANRDELEDFYLVLLREMELGIAHLLCSSESPSSSSASAASGSHSKVESGSNVCNFVLPGNIHFLTVPGITHLTTIIGNASLQRFGISSQCNDCEAAQGDDAIIIRHDKFRLGKEERAFVGEGHLTRIGDTKIRKFVWDWLRTDLEFELCVLNDIFKNLKEPDSAATKVLLKLRKVFECYYSLLMIALADGIPLCEQGLGDLLQTVSSKLPPPPKPSAKDEDDNKFFGFAEGNDDWQM